MSQSEIYVTSQLSNGLFSSGLLSNLHIDAQSDFINNKAAAFEYHKAKWVHFLSEIILERAVDRIGISLK